jgi:hypothetical protein
LSPEPLRAGWEERGIMFSCWKRIGVASVGGVLLSLAVVGTGTSQAGAATQTVTQLQVGGWFGANEGPGGSVGSVSLVPGPATPPSGSGSAMLQVDSTGRASLGTNAYKGTPLSQISALDYWDYPVVAADQANIQFDVTYDTTLGSTAYQGRLTFMPPASPAGTWTHLNTLTSGTWYGTHAPGNAICSQSTPCTWSQVLANFPNAAIRNDSIGQGALILRLGGPITGGATTYVDDLTVSSGANSTTTDFEAGGSITPTVGTVGTAITARGYGFKPNATVKVQYGRLANGRGKSILCTATADVTGMAQCTGNVPANSGALGLHSVIIKGRGPSGGISYSEDFVLS